MDAHPRLIGSTSSVSDQPAPQLRQSYRKARSPLRTRTAPSAPFRYSLECATRTQRAQKSDSGSSRFAVRVTHAIDFQSFA
jgi:hypothetical protein